MLKPRCSLPLLTTTIILSLGSSITSAQALGLTFQGTSSGVWGTPTADPLNNPNPYFDGVGTNTFSWGKTVGQSNSLSFLGTDFSVAAGESFALGNLTYFNGRTAAGTNVGSVPLNISLDLLSPAGIDNQFTFTFDLFSTSNKIGTPLQNSDFVFPIGDSTTANFTFGGQIYTLTLLGFSEDGGQTIVDQFRSLEGRSTQAQLYGSIVAESPATAVPEPLTFLGTITALGIGLLSRKQLWQQ